MTNRLTIYTRLDGSNNRIPGTSVLRKTRPRVGKWVEDSPLNICCFPYETVVATTDGIADDAAVDFSVSCDGTDVLEVSFTGVTTANTDEMAAFLNQNLSYLGTFTGTDTGVSVNLNNAVWKALCDDAADLGVAISIT